MQKYVQFITVIDNRLTFSEINFHTQTQHASSILKILEKQLLLKNQQTQVNTELFKIYKAFILDQFAQGNGTFYITKAH